ncbi:hypothetical protein [Hippea maritima]|uniref:Uncharacterized protein n=1 Tax=Hippea maritima (strain ATCC 700847 / DSM 10411 / MH2) TaxID=760142 RepID=F2LV39_HIPMA|nr:hypothetical protein [Hippea maritima]AEA33623.1 hypothetical protein Hipma_0653 [Hippea maritima DSM 10411]
MADVKANLNLWKAVEKTDMSYTKKVSCGQRTFTSINPYYQIRRATEIWGEYGKTWGFKDVDYQFITIQKADKQETYCVAKFRFFYPEGEYVVLNSIAVRDDEFMKKLYTDALTKALSYLGFDADIFMGEMDKEARYTGEVKKTETAANETVKKLENALKALGLKLENGKVVGRTYGKSKELKALGFVWKPEEKMWVLPQQNQNQIQDDIPF